MESSSMFVELEDDSGERRTRSNEEERTQADPASKTKRDSTESSSTFPRKHPTENTSQIRLDIMKSFSFYH
nr:hypothetical protein CFP56_31309 [Quercus suber]